MIRKEKVNTEKWGSCLKLENDYAEVMVSLDFGPRVLSYRLHGKENVFFEDPERTVYVDDEEIKNYYGDRTVWYNYGGHRLWINPEKMPETYHPDIDQVDYDIFENGAVFMQKEQRPNMLKLEISVTMDDESASVEVIHRVTNTGDGDKEFAIWAISPMAPGGTEIIPMGSLYDGALPNRSFSTWPYTDMSDDRLYVGKEFITLKQEPGNSYAPVNLGYNNPQGRACYMNNGTLFIDSFKVNEKGVYPDMGAAFETFSNEAFLEVESLGELKTVKPGETALHTERWTLKAVDEGFSARDEAEIKAFADKYL